MSLLAKYAVKVSKSLEQHGITKLTPIGDKGYAYATKIGEQDIILVKAKDFTGELSKNTLVVEGKNSDDEPRLYLTNKLPKEGQVIVL